jgi:hypothetical protein
MTRKPAGTGAVSLVSIDKLTAEQRAGLVAASREARPSEEYRIQFAALAQRRLEMQQATAISRGSAGMPHDVKQIGRHPAGHQETRRASPTGTVA